MPNLPKYPTLRRAFEMLERDGAYPNQISFNFVRVVASMDLAQVERELAALAPVELKDFVLEEGIRKMNNKYAKNLRTASALLDWVFKN